MQSCLLILVAVVGCGRSATVRDKAPTNPPEDVAKIRAQVHAFCGDCHAIPKAESFPRDAWFAEVEQGYGFYYDSQRTDLQPPPMNDVVAYFRAAAPESIALPVEPDAGDTKLRFRRQSLPLPEGHDPAAVSHIRWWPATAGNTSELLFCDMQSGGVQRVSFTDNQIEYTEVGRANNPAHIERCDLDGDGRFDRVIADLGSFLPADHHNGSVVWTISGEGDNDSASAIIQGDLGRVADVQPADVDGDGDQDLIVAEFGWRKTGRLIWLENTRDSDDRPQFRLHEIDSRHGAIHVPVTDLNGDGHPDFVALVSQEFETVDAFINNGTGGFHRVPLYAANDPSFGSSGIELVDLDRDGDQDILYTNGDLLDSFFLKPDHGVRWLENVGGLKFEHHLLTNLPGAFRALAADLDGDGDHDVVACAFVPPKLMRSRSSTDYDSLVWLEQISPGQFVRHRLERGVDGYLAMETGDFDQDGDFDLAVGKYRPTTASESDKWLTVWWNLRIE